MNKRGGHIIGIAGKMGSGKDTIAAMLRMRGYEKLAFGNAVREELVNLIRRRFVPVCSPKWVEWLILSGLTEEAVYAKPTSDAVRRLLQWIGTDWRRAENPAHWIEHLGKQMDPAGKYVFSDVRFRNEADYIKSEGGAVWLVVGRNSEGAGEYHESERIDIGTPDLTIDNRVAMYDLAGAVLKALGE